MINDIIRRILGLRAKFGRNRTILIQTTDVKRAFRQIVVDPAGAAALGYVVVASTMQDAQRKTTRETAVISGVRATSHVRNAPMTGGMVEAAPIGCDVPRLEGGRKEDGAAVSFFIDDAVSVEIE